LDTQFKSRDRLEDSRSVMAESKGSPVGVRTIRSPTANMGHVTRLKRTVRVSWPLSGQSHNEKSGSGEQKAGVGARIDYHLRVSAACLHCPLLVLTCCNSNAIVPQLPRQGYRVPHLRNKSAIYRETINEKQMHAFCT